MRFQVETDNNYVVFEFMLLCKTFCQITSRWVNLQKCKQHKNKPHIFLSYWASKLSPDHFRSNCASVNYTFKESWRCESSSCHDNKWLKRICCQCSGEICQKQINKTQLRRESFYSHVQNGVLWNSRETLIHCSQPDSESVTKTNTPMDNMFHYCPRQNYFTDLDVWIFHFSRRILTSLSMCFFCLTSLCINKHKLLQK